MGGLDLSSGSGDFLRGGCFSFNPPGASRELLPSPAGDFRPSSGGVVSMTGRELPMMASSSVSSVAAISLTGIGPRVRRALGVELCCGISVPVLS